MTTKNSSNFIHPKAEVQSKYIGARTHIWQFCIVLEHATIGCDCNICSHCFIENDVTIGDRVTIKSGVQLWDGILIEDDVFVGPNASFTNDLFPRSKQYQEKVPRTIVKKKASIGSNATILPGIVVGSNAMVGAGSVVTHNVPPNAIVRGNPARIVGYIGAKERPIFDAIHNSIPIKISKVTGVSIIQLKNASDLRGDLVATELEKDLPFKPKRVFFVHNVPNEKVRGEHAHKVCQQFMICIKGSLNVVVDDGHNREEFILDKPWIGLYLPPMVWGIQYKYSHNATLMVFASHEYDPDDYIRDYDNFLIHVNKT